MKAIRAILVLGIFIFLNFGLSAQSNIKGVSKNEINTETSKQTPTSYKGETVQKNVTTPTPVAPVPVPYPNTTTTTENKPPEEMQLAPSSSNQNNAIRINSQQTKAIHKKKKQDYQE